MSDETEFQVRVKGLNKALKQPHPDLSDLIKQARELLPLEKSEQEEQDLNGAIVELENAKHESDKIRRQQYERCIACCCCCFWLPCVAVKKTVSTWCPTFDGIRSMFND